MQRAPSSGALQSSAAESQTGLPRASSSGTLAGSGGASGAGGGASGDGATPSGSSALTKLDPELFTREEALSVRLRSATLRLEHEDVEARLQIEIEEGKDLAMWTEYNAMAAVSEQLERDIETLEKTGTLPVPKMEAPTPEEEAKIMAELKATEAEMIAQHEREEAEELKEIKEAAAAGSSDAGAE
jgi:hypothetical protein